MLPDQGGWRSSDTKVYSTVVTIDEEVEQLKPGMTAVVQIHVDRLEGILAVPVQAIVQVGNSTWCYVTQKGRPERRIVQLGATNDRFVEVCDGLEQGDQVVLNPSAIADSRQSKSESKESAPASDSPADGVVPAAEDLPSGAGLS